jgi:RNA polymerase sigma-70 factor (ECF subfamily)
MPRSATGMATGMAIASSVTTMGSKQLAQRGGDATSIPANDGAANDVLLDRRIGAELVAQYRSLISYSRRLTANGPEAADLVHIVFARVLSHPTPVADVENLSGWLRTVLFRTFIDLRRREDREIPTESAVLERQAAGPEEEIGDSPVTVNEVRALVAALPALYRAPYELFTFEHMPYAQIATVLGLSCTTVGTRINRARTRLRRLLRARHGG